jgi:hypothetical protein
MTCYWQGRTYIAVAGARASPYVALRLLFPDLVPVIARVSMRFPDRNLAKVIQVSCHLCTRRWC